VTLRRKRSYHGLTIALHWTTAMLRFWMNPRGFVLAVASERQALDGSTTADKETTL
jgi:cytochrome b561